MAVAVKMIRNKPPYNAGEKIGTDRLTADRLIKAGYAVKHDLEAEAKARAPKTAKSAEPSKPAKPTEPPAPRTTPSQS